jgi:hypothetical protein
MYLYSATTTISMYLKHGASNRVFLIKSISWVQAASGLWDLTRSAREPASTTYTISCNGARQSIVIERTLSALVIIDMQSVDY